MAALLGREGHAAEEIEVEDRFQAEVWMIGEGVKRQNASVLAGVSQAGGERALRWQALGGGRVLLSPFKHHAQEEVCVQLEEEQHVPRPSAVHVYNFWGPAADRDAEVILVNDESNEQALVSLRPGEQILTVHVEDRARDEQAEYLEVRSRRGRLMLVREGEGALTCYAPPAND